MGSKDGFNVNPPAPANCRPAVPPKEPPLGIRYTKHLAEVRRLNDALVAQSNAFGVLAAELDKVSAAIGTDAYLDPSDGGSVSLGEQVRRMRYEMVGLLQRVYDADQAARHEKPYNVSKLMDDIETVLQRHQQ